jgi:hypothetical protein
MTPSFTERLLNERKEPIHLYDSGKDIVRIACTVVTMPRDFICMKFMDFHSVNRFSRLTSVYTPDIISPVDRMKSVVATYRGTDAELAFNIPRTHRDIPSRRRSRIWIPD